MTKFEKECESYSVDDLELIIETQKDLYSVEEMEYIINTLSKKKEAIEIERIKNLPKEIKCPKCEVILPVETSKCPYCEFDFGNDHYRFAVTNNNDNTPESMSDNEEPESSGVLSYVLSFIVPLVGFIYGAILMSKDDEFEKSKGIKCIIIGIISMIISAIACLRLFGD